MIDFTDQLRPQVWYREGRGPRYRQLYRHIAGLISTGTLTKDDQLPPERDLSSLTGVSRVTVRRAIRQLVEDGLIEQRHGAGSFVRERAARFEQSLSSLISFTENLQARGIIGSSVVLQTGLFRPNPTETTVLGLAPHRRVARVERLRSGDDVPVALEMSSLPDDVLPRPELVQRSLYEMLRTRGMAPVRAVQRVTAVNASSRVAEHLNLPLGAAVLHIERTGFLASGRPIEFSSGLYRPDIYDFVSELRLD